MAEDLIGRLIDACVATVRTHAEHLTALDQAIGDGDHGHNMRRGFEEIAAQRNELAALPPARALQKAGMVLVMKVGGASGPLYGSLLMAMGKSEGDPLASTTTLAAAVADGVEGVRRRGRSDAGEKTMLDVLVPVRDALRRAAEDGAAPAEIMARVRAAALAGLEATRPLQASKGRASYLGERSIGHLDPGACSSSLLIGTICDVLAEGG